MLRPDASVKFRLTSLAFALRCKHQLWSTEIWKILKFGAEWSSLILFGFVHKTTLLYITDILSDAALQLTQTATLL